MATTEIHELANEKATPVGGDIILINDSAASNASKKATLANVAKAIQGAAVADLNQTISNPPTQAEVQAISDKVDALLASLRAANLLAT